MKKHIILIIGLILLNFTIKSNELRASVIEKKQIISPERGFAYQNEVETTTEKDRKLTTNEILLKILKEAKEIKTLLKNEYDPGEKIVFNSKGEECIANSSADCFVMPITNEAKRVPVIKNWMLKGDLDSAVKLLQWQSKYFSEISKRAYNNVSAINQFGPEAYPTNYNTMGFNNARGSTSLIRKKIEKEIIEKNLHKVNFIYFIGENWDWDLYSMDNIVKFLKEYGNKIKLQFIFKENRQMNLYKAAGSYNSEFEILNNYKMSVNPEEFINFNIHNSPSLVAINKKENTARTVFVGRAGRVTLNKMILMYMRNQGIITNKDLNTNQQIKNTSSYGKKYIKQLLGDSFIKNMEEMGNEVVK